MRTICIITATCLITSLQPTFPESNVDAIKKELKTIRQKGFINPNPNIRKNSAKALDDIVQELRLSGHSMVNVLMDSDPAVRAEVAKTLSSFGSLNQFAVHDLVFALKKETDDEALRRMIGAVAAMTPHAKAAIPLIIPHVKHKNIEVRRQAIAALGAYEAAAKAAVPALVEALDDPDSGVPKKYSSISESAMFALQRIGPDAKAAADALSQLLKATKNSQQKAIALVTLAKVVPKDRKLVPLFADIVQGKADLKIRGAAATALAVMGPEAADAVPALVESLKATDLNDPDGAALLRYKVLVALGEIGPAAKAAVPQIEQCLSDVDEVVRKQAKQVLDQLQKMK